MTPPPLYLLIILCFVGFVVFWCLILLLIARFGWNKLAKSHTAFSKPAGQKFSWQSCSINRWVNYNGCIDFHVGKSGLGISVFPIFAVGHPPLFFPWSKVRYRKEISSFFRKRYLYDMGAPRAGRITVPATIHQAIEAQTHPSAG